MGLFSIFKSDSTRAIRKLQGNLFKINALEEKYKAMSDEDLTATTGALKERLKNYETLNDILPDAFALVREASRRVLGMRHFDVQMLGGMVLHQGRISEMRTGEGKTLVATLPAYLNALTGEGVHVVTVNDYLAKRDAEWMGKIFRFLGLTVGVSVNGMEPDAKRAAYTCDITYATNNELGFDYLRDNMVINRRDMVLRPLSYAIVDEVDSILIDEARTPLIISGKSDKSSEMYATANKFARTLEVGENAYMTEEEMKRTGAEKDGDVDIDEKKKTVHMTEQGVRRAERYFHVENLSDADNSDLNHYINNALRANFIMKKDNDYIVADDEIIIIDEFTGRRMIGRRYSEGLHQAIEAKEGVRIQNENKTLATITFQNYFRLYKKLAGMTGTAKTEESEFRGIYKLDVVTIPTNAPMVRFDENDVIYATIKGKYQAIVEDIEDCFSRKQPVLVGTVSVERSEEVSKLLKIKKIPHSILNAKNHGAEAEIVAQAGKSGAVTIATNMAGRGTDIMLGGNAEYSAKKFMRDQGFKEEIISAATSYAHTDDPEILAAKEEYKKQYDAFNEVVRKEKAEVVEAGGLRIIGTERHESRRIDNQLRGRSGRQGDPGSSVFYISLEDDLARVFGGERLKRFMGGEEDNEPFQFRMMTRLIEHAQKNIEGRNFSIRKQVLEYDDVMNRQREIIYGERNKVLQGQDIHGETLDMIKVTIENVMDDYADPNKDWREWDTDGFNREISNKILPGDPETFITEERLTNYTISEIEKQLVQKVTENLEAKAKAAREVGLDFSEVERIVLLRIVDARWIEHIDAMDALRRGIGLRGYGQQDPVIAYKKEGFEMFGEMTEHIREETVMYLLRVNIQKAPERSEAPRQLIMNRSPGGEKPVIRPRAAAPEKTRKVGPNDPCPCGSGKKYKQCCMK
ncbi:protein translocase subunit SecA [Clostridia bacterium]|nr:protein translocase subunit SecA [Clostridia bacterium]